MKYILINEEARYPNIAKSKVFNCECYPVSDEGASLMILWEKTFYPDDKTLSGVLADWLEENRENLLSEGGDAGRLDLLIRNLRLRCLSTAITALGSYR